MISVSHLTRRFAAHTAVDDVSFELARGEVVGFLGPNGAGKTTTMRMLTGFLPPSAGTVKVDGFDVLTHSLEVRQRIGYLPESVPLYREHRVLEMLVFQGRLHGLARAEAKRRAG
ncbi:MAG: ATP-binding cassette domain-containing protein, partial [Planctomycetota bacterium]